MHAFSTCGSDQHLSTRGLFPAFHLRAVFTVNASRMQHNNSILTYSQAGAKQSNAKQSKAKQSKAKQSKAKQSKAKQSKAKQSKAKQSKAHNHENGTSMWPGVSDF